MLAARKFRRWGGQVMRRYTVGLGLIALALCGCATGRPPEIGYLAPTGVPPTARSAVIEQDPGLVMGNLVDRLQQENFKVAHLDERAGNVVVQYSGDPKPYVDCGWIVTYRTGGLDRIPAANASSSFEHMADKRELELKRDLRLDGRMTIRFDREGAETVVSPATTYVLTKTVDALGSDGVQRGSTTETISFATGERGKFSKGTVCQPNGQLERVVLDSLPANSIVPSKPQPRAPVVASEPLAPSPVAPAAGPTPAGTRSASESAGPLEAQVAAATAALSCAAVDPVYGDGHSVRLTGYVSSEQDRARLQDSLTRIDGLGPVDASGLEIAPPPTCELLQVLEPYGGAEYADSGLQVTTAGRDTRLREGEDLTLDIYLPRSARYLYLGYVQHDGRVGYITTMPVQKWAEDTGAIRYRTGFRISAPFGREMIVAVASTKPLFEKPRPGYEPAADYIAAIRERLSALRAGGGTVATSHLFITTEPARSS
jgi:hypothetical protein